MPLIHKSYLTGMATPQPAAIDKAGFFLKLHPLHRVLIGLAFAGITYIGIRHSSIALLLQLMVLWVVFAIVYLITAWIVVFTCTVEQLRQKAREEDGSRLFVFLLIVLSSFASIFTVLLLITSKNASLSAHPLYLPAAVLGMMLAWAMVHTTYTFHYAHLFYDDDANDPGKHSGGLDFPGGELPDYFDFAYFAIVVGMTFQVSDVQITDRSIRRKTLMHGLLSFALNTFVVALTINMIAGLKN